MQLDSNYQVIGQLKPTYLPYSVGIQKKYLMNNESNASCSI